MEETCRTGGEGENAPYLPVKYSKTNGIDGNIGKYAYRCYNGIISLANSDGGEYLAGGQRPIGVAKLRFPERKNRPCT